MLVGSWKNWVRIVEKPKKPNPTSQVVRFVILIRGSTSVPMSTSGSVWRIS